MSPNDIARVQDYLRRTFGNERIVVAAPARPAAPAEIRVGDEFIGVLYKDEEEGETSFDLHISILESDLPPASPAPERGKRR